MTRSSAGMVVLGAVLALMAYAEQAQGQVTLEVDRIIQTTPFVNSTIRMLDGEGMTYVPPNDTLWLGDDNGDRLYEVERASGHLLSVISASELANAVQLDDKTKRAGPQRAADIEALAYDPGSGGNDVLYVKSTSCCPSSPTAFRLVRSSPTQAFQVETYQPLEKHGVCEFTGSGFHPTEGIYVSCGADIRPYNYVSNTLGPSIPRDWQGSVLGLGFSADGNDLWLVTNRDRLLRIDWATKGLVPGYSFDLVPYGIPEARAVDVIDGQVYVLNGNGEVDLTVFNVVAAGLMTPTNLTAIPGSEKIDLSWTYNSAGEDGVEIQRCSGTVATSCGATGSFAVIASVGPNIITYSDLDATDGVTYTYRVRAFAGSVFSGFSNTVTAAAGAPTAPSALTATAISGTRIDLSWTDNSNNETGFSIELCAGPAQSCADSDFGEIDTVAPGVTTYSDVGLVPNTTYSYRVRAFNDVGDSAAAGPATATTLAQANLLQNPSFEIANGDGRPDVWTTVGAFSRSSEVVRSGSFAGKHFATTNAQYTVRQIVGVNAGSSHRFSGCANIPPTTDAFTFRFHLRWLSASGAVLAQRTFKTYTAPTGGAWNCVTTTGVAAPAGTTQAEVRMVAESINLTIYVDDLVFEVE
jgi:Fibronectin type III domain